MTMPKAAYRILLALLIQGAGVGTTLLHGQSTHEWATDTAELGAIRERMQRHFEHWDLDSMAIEADQMIRMADNLLNEASVRGDMDRRREAIGWKAIGSMGAGRSGNTAHHLDRLSGARELYAQIDDTLGMLEVDLAMAGWYDRNGRFLGSIDLYRSAMDMQRSQGRVLDAARTMNAMGVVHRKMGDHGSAIELHLEALPIIEAEGGASELGWQYIVIGAVYRSMRDWREAREYFGRARRIYVMAEDHHGTAVAYNDLGSAFQGEGLLDSALYWHQRAATLRRNSGDHNGSGDSYGYIAGIHLHCGDLEQASVNYDDSYKAYGRVNNIVGMAQALGSKAHVRAMRGDEEGAIRELRSAMQLLADGGRDRERSRIHFDMGRSLARTGKGAAALSEYEQGIAIAAKLDDLDALIVGYRALFEEHRRSRDPRSAYLDHRMYLQLKDSSALRAEGMKVAQLMMRHELEQDRMKEIAKDSGERTRMRQELETRRRLNYGYMAGGSLFAILAIGMYGRLQFTRSTRRKLRMQRRSLKRAKRIAEQSERFKDRFLANMSHEIRTPMNAIMGMSTIMRRNDHLTEQEPYLDGIVHNSENLLKILNDILDLSKLQADRAELELVPMDPHQIVNAVVYELHGSADPKGIRLFAEVDAGVPHNIFGDATRFKRLLVCLVENAIKFTDQGRVRIALTLVEKKDDRVVLDLAVEDTGVGIPSDRLGKVLEEEFEPYDQSISTRSGPGLGLAISRRIAELHGGSLRVESEAGAGSTFTARLPFALSGSAVPSVVETGTVLRDLRILLADDNGFNVMVAKDELTDAIPGVIVDVASNGLEAVDLFGRNRYDVILMDVQMPEMNGYDATRAIRAMELGRERTPILAMSANILEENKHLGADVGMDGQVPKPFKREELIHAIGEAVANCASR